MDSSTGGVKRAVSSDSEEPPTKRRLDVEPQTPQNEPGPIDDLIQGIDLIEGVYQPTTSATKRSYARLMHIIASILAEEEDVLATALEEIVAPIKANNPEAKNIAESILGPINDEVFHEIVSISEELVDFRTGAEEAAIRRQLAEQEAKQIEDESQPIGVLFMASDTEDETSEEEEETDSEGEATKPAEEASGEGAMEVDEEVEVIEDSSAVIARLEDTTAIAEKIDLQLPESTVTQQFRSYDQILIPPRDLLKYSPEDLVAVGRDLPPWARLPFKTRNITHLNPMQSKVFQVAFNESHENVLVSAPTGAGKTNVALLCMLNVIGQHLITENSSDSPSSTPTVDLKAFKIVYISPMKALVAEQVETFSQLLAPYNITVKEMTGDMSLSRQEMQEAQVIIATPEKLDVITRKSGERWFFFTDLVKLVIFDEIHLLHDTRGPVIEALVTRFRLQQQQQQVPPSSLDEGSASVLPKLLKSQGEEDDRKKKSISNGKKHDGIRLLGLSATLPNFEDVGAFLGVRERGLFHFPSSFRPVPLEQEFIGVKEKNPLKRIQVMNEICYEKCLAATQKYQVLIFVHSRKDTVKTAKIIKNMAIQNDTISRFLPSASSANILKQEAAENVKNKALKEELLPYGFAVHHAGLSRSDRQLVENLFAQRHIQVLVSTATLAWGVNLPAHSVIIKGTQIYNPEKGSWQDLSAMDMLQMIGRAGRPGLDTQGHGCVITNHSQLKYFLCIANSSLPVESQLLTALPDLLSAEVALGGISTRDQAINWLGYSFFFIRMIKNPTLYGLPADHANDEQTLRRYRREMIHKALNVLDRYGLVKYDRGSGRVESTSLGRIAASFYLKYQTIVAFNENMHQHMFDSEIFRVFTTANEFRLIPIRPDETIELQRLIERVPFPVRSDLDSATLQNIRGRSGSKVNVLLQTYISKLKLDGFHLMSDMVYVVQSALRLMRALFEIALRKRWSNIARKCLKLCINIDRQMWTTSCPLRQLGLSEDLSRRLEKRSTEVPFSRLFDLSPIEIGELIRSERGGREIHQLLQRFPRFEIETYVKPISHELMLVEILVEESRAREPHLVHVFVEDQDQEKTLHHECVIFAQRRTTNVVNCMIPVKPAATSKVSENHSTSSSSYYFVRVVSDSMLHAERMVPINLRSVLFPAAPTKQLTPGIATSVVDLPSVNLHSVLKPLLRDLSVESLFPKQLNGIQTMMYPAVFESDQSVVICAAEKTGKALLTDLSFVKFALKIRNQKQQQVVEEEEGDDEDGDVKKSNKRKKSKSKSSSRDLALLLCPHEYKCEKRYSRLSKILSPMGLRVELLAGVELAADVKSLQRCHVAVCSYSTWNAIMFSLSSRRRQTLMSNLALFVAQDFHFMDQGDSEDDTASAIETALTQVVRCNNASTDTTVRIVLSGSSISNAEEVAEWIGIIKPKQSQQQNQLGSGFASSVVSLGPSSRPVPLDVSIAGHDQLNRSARFAACLRNTVNNPSTIGTASEQSLIFVANRADAQETALQIALAVVTNPNKEDIPQIHPNDLSFESLGEGESVVLKGCILDGQVGFLHEGMSRLDQSLMRELYQSSRLRALVVVAPAAGGSLSAFSRTLLLDGLQAASVTIMHPATAVATPSSSSVQRLARQVLRMISFASSPSSRRAKVSIMCATAHVEIMKHTVFQAMPLESSLDERLSDVFNSLVASNSITSMPEALEWLADTFYYRRLLRNPAAYGLKSTDEDTLSDFLSELVEAKFQQLHTVKCVQVGTGQEENVGDEEDLTAVPLNQGLIANHYAVSVDTMELFARSLAANRTRRRYILQVLSHASEFAKLHESATFADSAQKGVFIDPQVHFYLTRCIRNGKFAADSIAASPLALLSNLATKVGIDLADSDDDEEGSSNIQKLVHVLLLAHMSRIPVPNQFIHVQKEVLRTAIRVLNAMVDTLTSNGWLQASLVCMDMSQLLVQASGATSSLLEQLPFFDSRRVAKAEKEFRVNDVFGVMELDDDVRDKLFEGLEDSQVEEIAAFCNRFPSVEISRASTAVEEDGVLRVDFAIVRQMEEEDVGANAYAARFPLDKEELWWVLLGRGDDGLLGVKKVKLNGLELAKGEEFEGDFEVDIDGDKMDGEELKLYLICDSYRGADQHQIIKVSK